MSVYVRHRRYGRGRLISFNPLLYMVIEFPSNGTGKKNVLTISSTREHMAEVFLDGRRLSDLVDLRDPRWYAAFHWRCKDMIG